MNIINHLRVGVTDFVLFSFRLIMPLSLFCGSRVEQHLKGALGGFYFFSQLTLVLSIRARGWWLAARVGHLLPVVSLVLYAIINMTRAGGTSVRRIHGLILTRDTVTGLCISSPSRRGIIRTTVHTVLGRLSPRSACLATGRMRGVGRPLRNGFRNVNIRFGVTSSALFIVRAIDGNPSRGINVLPNSHVIAIGSATVTKIGVTHSRVVGHLHNPGNSMIRLNVIHHKCSRGLAFHIAHSGVPMRALSTTCVVTPGMNCVGVDDFNTAARGRFDSTLTALGRRGVRRLVLSLRNGKKNCLGTTISVTDSFLRPNRRVMCARNGDSPHSRFGTRNGNRFYRKHLIILVSRCSTSTSRVIANTMRS